HKYDPFSQREYYQFFAFFDSDQEVNIPAPMPGDADTYQRQKVEFDKKAAELQAAISTYTKAQLAANQLKWEVELKLPERRKLAPNLTAILLTEPSKRTDKQTKELSAYYAKVDTKLNRLNKALAGHQKTAPTQGLAQTLALGPHRKTHVMIRGD